MTATPKRGTECRLGWEIATFRPISCFISEMIKYMAIVTMEFQYELVRDLAKSAISNDTE